MCAGFLWKQDLSLAVLPHKTVSISTKGTCYIDNCKIDEEYCRDPRRKNKLYLCFDMSEYTKHTKITHYPATRPRYTE